MRRGQLTLLLLAFGLSFGCIDEPSIDNSTPARVEVVDAVSHPSAGAPVGVVYLRVLNHAVKGERLLSAKASVAKSAELHETVASGDMMRMIHHPEGFDISSQSELTLAAGGKHIMLTGLAHQLEEGASFDLELVFEQAGPIQVVVPVRPRAH